MYRWIGWITVCYLICCANIGAAAPPRLAANSLSTLLIPAGMNPDDAIARLVAQAPATKDKTVLIDGENEAAALPGARERGAIVASTIATAVPWIDGLELVQADQAPVAGKVGLQTTDAVILVNGRELINLGPGEVKLHLARSAQRESRVVTLAEKERADLHELRRAAWERANSKERSLGVPEVPRGALVIVGGGGMPREIAERFFKLGGGAQGRFVVLPTAMDPVPPGDAGAFLKKLGAEHVNVIAARTPAELETPETLALFAEATAIWFGGGRQWRFVDAYEGTKIYDALHDVLRRGGVIGGGSAGATIQGDYLVRGAPAGPHIMMCEGYERGFSFLPGTAIDQHFKQRNRFADMTAFMSAYPQFLGIGLDEATAIVVQGTTAEVLGAGQAHFYDRRKAATTGEPDHTSFAGGARYDLKARQKLE